MVSEQYEKRLRRYKWRQRLGTIAFALFVALILVVMWLTVRN